MNEEAKPKRSSVTILAVRNGYVVTAESPVMRDCRLDREDHVFETFDAMAAFLHSQLPVFPKPPEPATFKFKATTRYTRNK